MLQPHACASQWPWAREALLQFGSDEALVWVDDQVNPPCARSVSYAELVEMADRVSRVVMRQAASNHEIGVGLCLDNSLAAVTCQLGALWAGHHFVPLDQPSVQPRLREMLNASRIAVIFCCPQLAEQLRQVADACTHSISVLLIDDAELTTPACAHLCMATDAIAEEAPSLGSPRLRRVCTFHTSGTTGTPKPIHSTPEQWSAFVTAAAHPYHLTAASRIFLATSAIFDPSAGLTFAALAA